MKVYTFVDSRSLDRYIDFIIFKSLEDAEKMRDSMGDDARYYDIHEVEVIK